MRIQDERLGLIERNASDLVKLNQSIEDVQKGSEKQRDEFLEMIENMKSQLDESSLKNMMIGEIEAFGFDEEIKQLKFQIENDKVESVQKTEELRIKFDENIVQQQNMKQEISERVERVESWIQNKSYEDALNERFEAIRKEVLDLKETFEDKL